MDRRQSIHRQIAGVTLLSALAIGHSTDARPIAALFTIDADDATLASAAHPSSAERR